jgi:hypothetical protein
MKRNNFYLLVICSCPVNTDEVFKKLYNDKYKLIMNGL